MLILDLGCGKNKFPGAIGIDKIKTEQVDIVCDIETGIPFEDSSVDLVICHHVLEHVNNFMFLMGEIYRVLKSNGRAQITVPYYTCADTYADPTHKRAFTESTFDYFTESSPLNYYSPVRFCILQKIFVYNRIWRFFPLGRFLPFKKYLRSFLWNIVTEIKFELEPIK